MADIKELIEANRHGRQKGSVPTMVRMPEPQHNFVESVASNHSTKNIEVTAATVVRTVLAALESGATVTIKRGRLVVT